jgi:tRNA pseudouridine55 synthase
VIAGCEVERVARDGLIVVDKPAGMTSHDVVGRIRRLARTRRVGHAGTLDPMATGVLVVGVERATRLLTYLVGHDKVYRATVRLGQSTVTDDAEGEVTATASTGALAEADLRAAAAAFIGSTMQVPSAVSAIKVNGVRAYARVRQGEQVALAARPVVISRLVLTAVRRVADAGGAELVDVDIEVACSAGTYVRAIARDLGARLGVGGHLTALRRTAVGPITLVEASTLDELAERDDPVTVGLDEAVARAMPRHEVGAEPARVLSHGGPLPALGREGPYAVFGPDGRVIAIVAERDGLARAQVVFAPATGGGGAERVDADPSQPQEGS